MKRFSFVLLAFGLVAAVGSRAGEISQKSNTQDRSFERLKSTSVGSRGSFKADDPANISLQCLDYVSRPDLATVDTATGNGDAEIFLVSTLALQDLDQPTRLHTRRRRAEPATLQVNIDIWPKIPPADATAAEIRAFVKDPANWPSDSLTSAVGNFGGFCQMLKHTPIPMRAIIWTNGKRFHARLATPAMIVFKTDKRVSMLGLPPIKHGPLNGDRIKVAVRFWD